MKKYTKIICSFVLMFSLLLSSVSFANEDFDDLFGEDDAPKVEWKLSDFVVEGDTIYGFSKAGVEKLKSNGDVVLPKLNSENQQIKNVASFAFLNNKKTAIADYTAREGVNGEVNDKDVDGNVIKNLGEEFNESYIKSVTIPEGYIYIGSDAFSWNTNFSKVNLADSIEYISEYAFGHNSLVSVKLPKNLKKLGDQSFFDNSITGDLVIPENFEIFGERSFKSNKITDITFSGDKVKIIPEECFQDNQLTKITIPTSIEKIDKDAFSGNIGDENYGNFIVLVTKDGTNPHNLPDSSFYVNPTEDKRTIPLDMDYTKWEEKDFVFDGSSVKGFSQIGKIKVKRNKNLVIPEKNGEILITEISPEAFRNVNFDDKNLNKYDLESITLPTTVVKIGDFAFQSNNLTDFTANSDLKEIGKGAFMNNKIETLDLMDSKVEVIDDAAFHINKISAIVISENVKKIGISAFRHNGANFVAFMGENVEEIGEMAFLSNAISDLDLSNLKKLKKIDVQTFADNEISSVKFPENLTEISEEAFKINKLTDIELPLTVNRIAFNSFDENGTDKVNVEVVGGKNINKIPDGNNFILNKDELATSKEEIEKLLTEIENIDFSVLREETKKQFTDIKNEGKKLLEKENLREGEKLKFIYESKFFIQRIKLDELIKGAEKSLENPKNKDNVKLLKGKLEYAIRSYNNSALTDKKVKRLEKELKFLTDLVNNTGEISKAKMIQGHHLLESPLPIPEYHIGMNVYFNNEGKILYVLDMSYTIGEGQKDEYGNDILNVDEDNEGYHVLALETLDDYEGLSFEEILSNDVNSIGKISTVEKAMYHREGIYNAIKDAVKDYKKEISEKTSDKLDIVIDTTNSIIDDTTIYYKDNLEKVLIFDDNKNISVEGLKDKLKDLTLKTEKLDHNIFESLKGKDVDLYNIEFINSSGKVLNLKDGKYIIKIQKKSNKKVVAVYYVDDNGKLESLNFKENENTIDFETTHFSKYAIEYQKDVVEIASESENSNVKNNTNTKNVNGKKVTVIPKTAVASTTLLSSLISLACVFSLLVFRKKLKINK